MYNFIIKGKVMSEIIIYENANVELKATVEDENIWLSQKDMGELFGVQRPAITKHLNNILKLTN